MSLFKAREWWQARAGQGEEFDTNSMCLANVDNDPNGVREYCLLARPHSHTLLPAVAECRLLS